ncbi:hypothetical protein [Sphingopyxis microcysteis]|uniref:hypothetical protein n=1 Tax=Sphingopyxis microcysteis TaxID=2484145 RepID=UPI001445720A|nr:hypothetical protein [Sphingopyxis microcysteis]
MAQPRPGTASGAAIPKDRRTRLTPAFAGASSGGFAAAATRRASYIGISTSLDANG